MKSFVLTRHDGINLKVICLAQDQEGTVPLGMALISLLFLAQKPFEFCDTRHSQCEALFHAHYYENEKCIKKFSYT